MKKKRKVKPKQDKTVFPERVALIKGFFFFCFVILFFRAFSIHIFPTQSQNLKHIANKQYQRNIALSQYRGSILDHRKEPLAISLKKPSLFINPRLFDPTSSQQKRISRILGVSRKKINQIKKKKGYFAWLKRKISDKQKQNIEKLDVKGLYAAMEPDRFYPLANHSAQFIGIVSTDDSGLFGIEKLHDKFLQDAKREISPSRDAKGNHIYTKSDKAIPETTGHNIILTIDRAIQEIASKALARGVQKSKAKAG